MRLWHSLALVVVTIALVLSLCKVREVSAQRNDGSGTVVASQPPLPGEPAAQVPGQPVPGQPPVPARSMWSYDSEASYRCTIASCSNCGKLRVRLRRLGQPFAPI